MNWPFFFINLVLFLAAFVSIALALVISMRPRRGWTATAAVLMLAIAEWSLGYALELNATTVPAKLLWVKVQYVGIVVAPAAWVLFALRYTGRAERRRHTWLLVPIPLVTVLLALTNEYHHLMWRNPSLGQAGAITTLHLERGGWFWVYVVYAYLVMLVGSALLVMAFLRFPTSSRWRLILLVLAPLFPWLGNIVYVTGLSPIAYFDPTVAGFAVGCLITAWGIFRLGLLDIIPIAHRTVIDSMEDGVLVLDLGDQVVDINKAGEEMLGIPAGELVGKNAEEVLSAWPALHRYRGVMEVKTEMAVEVDGKTHHYDLTITPLHGRGERPRGRLVVWRDVTQQWRTRKRLAAQNQLFEDLVAIARASAQEPGLQTTLHNTLQMAISLTSAHQGSLFLFDESGHITHGLATDRSGAVVERRAAALRVMEKGVAGWVMRYGETALIPDVLRDDRWLALPGVSFNTRSALSVPVSVGGKTLGVLSLLSARPGSFSKRDAALMQAASDQIALALRNAQIYEEQRQRAHYQSILYRALRQIGENLDPAGVAESAVATIAELTGWPAVAILMPDDAWQNLVVQAASGVLAPAVDFHFSLESGISGRAFTTNQTQVVTDVDSDPDRVGDFPAVRSGVFIPIRRAERRLGVFVLESDRTAAFNKDDIWLAESLAESIALAMDNARFYAEVRRYVTDMGAIYAVTQAISQTLILEEVLAATLTAALETTRFDMGLVSLVDPAGDGLYLAAEEGLLPPMAHDFRERGGKGTLCSYAHQSGDVLHVPDLNEPTRTVQRLQREVPDSLNRVRELGLSAYSGVPLLYQNRSLGTLCLFAHQPRQLSADDLALQVAIAQQAGAATANAQMFRVVRDEQRRLKAIIEASRDGIALVGPEQLLVINQVALDLLGLAGGPEQWVNRPLLDLLRALQRRSRPVMEMMVAEIRRVQEGDRATGEGEFEVEGRTLRWLNLPIPAGHATLGRLVVLQNVTEQRIVQRMQEQLRRTAVHDLRNPLNVVSGALDMLEQVAADEPNVAPMLQAARRSTARMMKLVNELLDVGRLESGLFSLERSLFVMGDVVQNVLAAQAPLAAEKELDLAQTAAPGTPLAWADFELMARVLENLVGNAIKFTPAGGEIEVRLAPAEEGRALAVSVADTGPGIAPDMEGRLFEKFVTGNHEAAGTGLGLAFCQMVVEAHGGRIWVESEPGEGATFTFTIPSRGE